MHQIYKYKNKLRNLTYKICNKHFFEFVKRKITKENMFFIFYAKYIFKRLQEIFLTEIFLRNLFSHY